MAIKYQHLTDQYFNRAILKFTVTIRKAKERGALDANSLFRILSGRAMPPHTGIIGPSEHEFVAELLPYANGERKIDYEIRRR